MHVMFTGRSVARFRSRLRQGYNTHTDVECADKDNNQYLILIAIWQRGRDAARGCWGVRAGQGRGGVGS